MTGMNVDIGHDGHFQFPALFPDQAELAAVELDDSVVEAMWIDVVVKEELLDSLGPPVGAAEQEGAAFAPATGATFQSIDARVPDARAANHPRRLAESCAQQRWK